MAVRVLLVLAALTLLCGCGQESSPAEKQEKQGGVEEAVGGDKSTAREGEGVAIEKAVLRRGEAGDEIVVRGRLGNAPAVVCNLTEGTLEEAEKRASAALEAGAKEASVHSLWAKKPAGEEHQVTAERGAFSVVFHENPNPPKEAGDPRRTPFFAYCVGGATFKKITTDEVHVQGTPKAP
jgi:hypothetical protein